MIFTRGTTVVVLDDPAQYPSGVDTELIQTKDRSASGVLHTESYLIQLRTYTYNFANMSTADYDKVVGFFINEAVGMMNEFELTDDLGVARNMKFTEPTLAFQLVSYQRHSGAFQVEVV